MIVETKGGERRRVEEKKQEEEEQKGKKGKRERLEDAFLLALRLEDGSRSQGEIRWTLESGKGKETGSSLEPPRNIVLVLAS